MKKLLMFLSLVLFVCACDPADTSSKTSSSDRYPTPSISVNNTNKDSTPITGENPEEKPSVSVSVPQGDSTVKDNSNSLTSSSIGEVQTPSSSENKTETSSSSEEKTPGNILSGGGFGGLH